MTLRRILAACVLALALAPLAAAGQPRPEQQDEFVPISELPPQEQLPAQPLVVAAYAFAWLALGGYVVSVARRLTAVHKEIEACKPTPGAAPSGHDLRALHLHPGHTVPRHRHRLDPRLARGG